MLRAALPLTGRAVSRHSGKCVALVHIYQQRAFADIKKTINDPTPPVLPGSQSKTASTPLPPGSATSSPPLATSEKTIPPANVPLTPPAPPSERIQTSPPTSVPPSSAKQLPPPPKKPKRRLRRFFLSLILLGGLSYAGSVWYSLRSDNFHDFFTEYIPFGEEAVLYFEEREFRKRWPSITKPTHRPSPDSVPKITIPSNSGLSWKDRSPEKGGSDLETKGRHMSAVDDNKIAAGSQQPVPKTSPPSAPEKKPEVSKKKAPEPATSKASEKSKTEGSALTESGTPAKAPSTEKPFKMPSVDEPNTFVPIARIDPLNVRNADEPLVQDLVKMLNDIILVVNADNSTGKYTSSITKAKNELAEVGRRILELKAAEKKAADDRVNSTQVDFDKAARELVRRLEQEMHEQEGRWRDEFESERRKIAQTYDERLVVEVEKAKQVVDQKQRNELLEQAIYLKKEFANAVQDRVESERQGRLAKLASISSNLEELEKLTSQWNAVLDANLKTQHLQVAVEAVRSSLERTDRPRPFIKELAALKELAAENSVVDGAIASINPLAYQIGVPTSAQLIDRFRRVADEVRKASLLPEDAGLASHAASFLLSKVMFKKHGRAVGEDVESILTRTETLLEEGYLDEAAREMNTLQGWAKNLSKDWLGEVRKVLEVRQALDVISTEARLQSLKVD